MRYQIITHETHSPKNARQVMAGLANRAGNTGAVPGTPQYRRARALRDTLDELAAATPVELGGWAVLTYLLLAGGSVVGERALPAYAARQATLMELHRYAVDILRADEHVIDLDGAIDLGYAWCDHASSNVEHPPARYAGMARTLGLEYEHLVAIRRNVRHTTPMDRAEWVRLFCALCMDGEKPTERAVVGIDRVSLRFPSGAVAAWSLTVAPRDAAYEAMEGGLITGVSRGDVI